MHADATASCWKSAEEIYKNAIPKNLFRNIYHFNKQVHVK